ncbi:MAG: TetR/AcrR family transcriptional regulator [Solirubrobacteraceae bacterium]|nr:TetR/AcrR family transcriptional regulator [Patulibacter sp.]
MREAVPTPWPGGTPTWVDAAQARSPAVALRERILDAMAVVVARDGLHASRLADVVKVAGISLSTFYRCFRSKDEAVNALHQHLASGAIGSIERSVALEGDPRDAIRQAAAAYYRALSAHPKLVAALVLDFAATDDEALAAREASHDAFAELLMTLIERTRAAHPELAIRPLSPVLARGLVGSIHELTAYHLVHGTRHARREIVDATTDLVWSVIRD